MNYSSRFWLYAPFCTFLSLAAIAMVHWRLMDQAFEKKLSALNGHQAIPGVTLSWDKVAVGGFPFRLDADFSNFRVRGAGAHGPFQWQSEKFALHTLTYGRDKTVYEAAGLQHASWTDVHGRMQSVNFLPGSLRASSILDPRGLSRADLDIVGLGSRDFAIGHLQFHMRRNPDGVDLDLMLRADAVGHRGRVVQVYATVSHADLLAPLLAGHVGLPIAVASWRAKGGSVTLSQVIAPGIDAASILAPLY